MQTKPLLLFYCSFFLSLKVAAQYVVTVAGLWEGFADGEAQVAKFSGPVGLTVDLSGNIYVADTNNNMIRRISSMRNVTTFAGSGNPGSKDGTGSSAEFRNPQAITIDKSDNLYVCDTGNHRIRKISPNGTVSTIAVGSAWTFGSPTGIAVDESGNLFFTDTLFHRIYKINPSGDIVIFAGTGAAGLADGIGTSASFYNPNSLALDAFGNLFLTDNYNRRIRKITSDGTVTTIAGSSYGYVDGTGSNALFKHPTGIAVDSSGNLFVSDAGSHTIRKISPSGTVYTFAGFGDLGRNDGYGSSARFYFPCGIAFDSAGRLYVADSANSRIRRIDFNLIIPVFPNLPLSFISSSISAAPTVLFSRRGNFSTRTDFSTRTNRELIPNLLETSVFPAATAFRYQDSDTSQEMDSSAHVIALISSFLVVFFVMSFIAGFLYMRSVRRRHKNFNIYGRTTRDSRTALPTDGAVFQGFGSLQRYQPGLILLNNVNEGQQYHVQDSNPQINRACEN